MEPDSIIAERIAGNIEHGDLEAATRWIEHIRADERKQVAQELRDTADEQSGWLWFDVGESTLHKIAAYIAPRREASDGQ